MASLFFGKVFSEILFDDFRNGNLDSRFSLPWEPITFVRFGIETNKRSDVSFHRLVFAQWKGEDEQEALKALVAAIENGLGE